MKKKRTPWPRWAKVLRNLLLAAVLGFMMWDLWGHPTFTYRASLRRTERQWLVPETECVAEISRGIWGVDVRIGLTEGAAIASVPTRGKFFTNAAAQPYDLTDGPNLIALPWMIGFLEEGTIRTYVCYAALQAPEGSASAVLTLHNADGTFVLDSSPPVLDGWQAENVLLFCIRPESDENGVVHLSDVWFNNYTYELAFFDENGDTIQEITG